MATSKQKLIISILWIIIALFIFLSSNDSLSAQVYGPQEIKWMRVGSLRSWFANSGSEIEYGRRGRATALSTDQTDGLRWPAQYQFQDVEAAKHIWIGTLNFADPVSGVTYSRKVAGCGPRAAYLESELMPYEFKMIGRFDHPRIFVDNAEATDNVLDDVCDEIDANLIPDRMIIDKLYTSIGISITRKIMAFSNQYHDNYYIYDYVFTNTGIIDLNETRLDPSRTLTGVIVHFGYRYAFAYEAFRTGRVGTGTSWGKNTMNDVVGEDNMADGAEFRALYAWYGPHSAQGPWEVDVGHPDVDNGRIMTGTQYAGVVTLHASQDVDHFNDDDPYQPRNTYYMASDHDALQSPRNQYEASWMAQRYDLFMNSGHPAQSHAEQVGNGFADAFSLDEGGFSQGHGFGPYTIPPGDSIHIILAEGVCGISREKNREIIYNWFNQNSDGYILPDGTTATDRNEYKNAWVWSGKDSLFQTFRRAISNYASGYNIPKPPPPPDEFIVNSGGDRVFLSWSANAETWPNFDGYQVCRAVNTPDTTFDLIYSCDASNKVNTFEDVTAKRGFDYYYYVVTKDDGSTNDIEPGVPLVSSKFYTMTNMPAQLRRPPGKTLADIRIVPNPYNIRAARLQFGETTPDRIAFYGLPPFCTIKIYTENGDLIKTIEHTSSSGDELWDSLTSSNQLVVSGLYIAYFEVSKDFYDQEKGLNYKKGQNTFRKFIIIR